MISESWECEECFSQYALFEGSCVLCSDNFPGCLSCYIDDETGEPT